MHVCGLEKLLVDARAEVSAFSSFSRPQKCIIFLENIGTPSSVRFRIWHKNQDSINSAELEAQRKNAVYKDSQLYNLKRELRTRERVIK